MEDPKLVQFGNKFFTQILRNHKSPRSVTRLMKFIDAFFLEQMKPCGQSSCCSLHKWLIIILFCSFLWENLISFNKTRKENGQPK